MKLTECFALALKHYRELAGMSLEDLAAASALDRTFVSQLERGLKKPGISYNKGSMRKARSAPSFLEGSKSKQLVEVCPYQPSVVGADSTSLQLATRELIA